MGLPPLVECATTLPPFDSVSTHDAAIPRPPSNPRTSVQSPFSPGTLKAPATQDSSQ